MKKIVLSMAGVLAATAFAPEASALPAFARQTGMACNACHAQHFPVLNGFGRAFKASGYTLMGAQGKIEGDNLSIPDTLNGAILLKYRYFKDNSATTGGAGQALATSKGNGQWQMADEYSLFFGGRVADSDNLKIGFLMENNVANAGGTLVAGTRLPIVYDMGAVKLMAIPFTTDALGVSYGFELSSGGVARANRWSENRRETSAIQYNADQGKDGGAASGFAYVVQNDLFFVNYTAWSSSFAPGANGQAVASTDYRQKYIRAAVTPSLAGFDLVAGVGRETGSSYSNTAGATAEANQTFFDLQAQGEVAGLEASFYAQHANAPACGTALAANCAHNKNGFTRKATTIGTEFGVIPHTLSVGLAYRNAQNGTNPGLNRNGDNAINISTAYELFQNVALHADFAKYSGNAHNLAGDVTYAYVLMLEGAW